jgi:type VI secretion system protein ImpC
MTILEAAATAQATETVDTGADAPVSLVNQMIAFTKQTPADQAKELLIVFVQQILNGTIKWDKNLTVTMNEAIQKIDQKLSEQLRLIMHTDEFKKAEGSWSGLHHLVMNSETGTTLKIKVMNATKREVFKDLDKAAEFDQSQLFKKIYESEFGSAGGEPYSVLISDYDFMNTPDDLGMLKNISGIAASSFCPFIASANPSVLGFDSWTSLSKPRDLAKIFESAEYISWRDFRDSEDARFMVLTLPRVLARLPYGAATKPIDEFDYEEAVLDGSGRETELQHEDYCWMNPSFVYGAKITEAFSEFGWCTAIRGAEGGGKVEGLPMHIFKTDDGEIDAECPTEIGITDRREAELSGLGFLPLCHYKNTDYAVFFGGQTLQKPKIYDLADATANASISARLPYIMATSRIAHFLKIMARDKIGSFMEASNVETWLNNWIRNYVNGNKDAGQEMKSRFPLAEAEVKVEEIPGHPGSYNAIAWLRPWLQMEELTASLRLVAKIPKLG